MRYILVVTKGIKTLSSLLPLLTRERLILLCHNENMECDSASGVDELAKAIIDSQNFLLEDVLGALSIDELMNLCVIRGCFEGVVRGTPDDVICSLVSQLICESVAVARCMLRKYYRRSGIPRAVVVRDHAGLFCRANLPDGCWEINVCAQDLMLKICAVCQRTGDKIEAVVCMDAAPGCYGITLPGAFFFGKNVWVLDYLEPRLPLAKGGTVELLRWIGSAADRVDATIVTWVNTENPPEVVAGVLRRHGGFLDLPVPRLIMHRPCLSERHLGGDLDAEHHHQ